MPRCERLGKGEDRPVNGLADRMALLASLECVSLVTWFDEDTPMERIRDAQPGRAGQGRRLAGGEHRRLPGGDRLGRRVHSIPFLHERSTTALLEKIRRL
jgi:bifunctional ADP-heptose synthase (sugar kinase/adenylyltransferase)